MNNKILKKWSEAAFELAKQIKKDDSPSIYSYMIISSSTIIELFFTTIDSIKSEDFPFTTKNQYIKKLKDLKPNQIKQLYVFFLLDYFPFLKLEMNPEFFKVFPISYQELLEGFQESFNNFPTELRLLEKTIEEYERPFHSRTFLQRSGLPINQDDIFLIQTLNEFKYELFHQFNKNISRLIKARNRKL
ncbi:hypothetical protein AAGG74_17250 [Bacillus mexicanus]|uniref:hypothetical protein n=1 Tax=Bacillus mexicanus TaxID=2834415 RepID=UPI003D1A06A7